VTLLEYVRVALLADFAFEFLPVVRGYVFTVLLLLTLCFNPLFQALKVDKSD